MKHWKKLLWAGVCLLCLMGAGLLWHGDRETVSQLTPQLAAERWETEEKPYAMVSVFLPEDGAIPASGMGEVCLSVENALTAGGVPSDAYPWYYAASRQESAVLQKGAVSCEVELTLVAGEFFRIHPMTLLDGWYMDEEDVMHDRIVLSRQAAWDLFYSIRAAGQYLELGGVQYQVAAVVDTEPGKYNAQAAGDGPRAWVLADGPGLTQEGEEPGYTCLEMVLPQPVKDFAASTLKTALGDMAPDKTAVTDNSTRFSLKNRWTILRSISTRGISSGGTVLPYWENAARLTENHLALRLIPEAVLLLIPLLGVILLLLWLNHRRTWGLHSIREAIENAVERKRRRDYDAALSGQPRKKPRRKPDKALRYDKPSKRKTREKR